MGVRDDVSMVVNTRIYFCQEILATGLKPQPFFFLSSETVDGIIALFYVNSWGVVSYVDHD